MAQRDKMHQIVITALEKDGWCITDDPFVVKYELRRAEIDLAAEKLIAAEQDNRQILVEVKSFMTPSPFYELHAAIGQYGNYRRLLALSQESRPLYLAMPKDQYEALLLDEFGALTIEEVDLHLLIFDPDHQTISQWIK